MKDEGEVFSLNGCLWRSVGRTTRSRAKRAIDDALYTSVLRLEISKALFGLPTRPKWDLRSQERHCGLGQAVVEVGIWYA